jgi:hypothetical protein
VVYKESGTQHRRHRNRAEADRLAAEYEASELSQADFCIQRDLPLKTLGRYLTRYRKQKSAGDATHRFVAVEIADDDGRGKELTVLLRGGRRIEVKRGFDAGTLQQLVAVLERG